MIIGRYRRYLRNLLISLPFLILFFIISDAIIAPILEYHRLEVSRKFYNALHLICNQLPTRSLFIYTSPMALCSRCFFIYLGLFITGSILIKNKITTAYWKIGIILLLPCIIDGGTQYLGFRLSNNGLRSITGGLAGIGIGLILFPIYYRIVNLINKGGW